MRAWPTTNWFVFFFCLFVAISIITTMGFYYSKAGIEWYYLGLLFAILGLLFIPAYVMQETHVVHVHHYNIGMIFLVLIAYQNYALAIFSGIANGWLIEGVTVYAYDPVFKTRQL